AGCDQPALGVDLAGAPTGESRAHLGDDPVADRYVGDDARGAGAVDDGPVSDDQIGHVVPPGAATVAGAVRPSHLCSPTSGRARHRATPERVVPRGGATADPITGSA